jgi:phosphatidylglycerol---prolipoprotein diacylglyceryl transferase
MVFLPQRLKAVSFFSYPFGVVSWGGVVGGFITAVLVSRLWKLELLKMADLIIPSVTLGFAFGRLGCFFAGCCYGMHYEGPASQVFGHPLAPATLELQPLFPAQIISAVFLFLLTYVLWRIGGRNGKPGHVLLAYAFLYGMGRFVIEFVRNDPRFFLWGLSDGQLYSLFLIAFGLGMLFYRRRSRQLA